MAAGTEQIFPSMLIFSVESGSLPRPDMNQPCIIRPASVADASAVCEAVRRSISNCCAADHQHDPVLLAAWLSNKTPDNFARWMQNPGVIALLAEREHQVLGFALVNGDHLALCYLIPEAQHQGIGQQLLMQIEAQARAHGITTLKLESTRSALAFYLRNAYQISAPPQLWQGLEGQPMQKHLQEVNK